MAAPRDVHGRLAVHRMPRVSGGVQAVEPAGARRAGVDRHLPEPRALHGQELPARPVLRGADDKVGVRWHMMSDVCKHCAQAGCLEACPTGAIYRTEFGTVNINQDICNGCRYCVSACPFGVVAFNHDTGTATKCTFCNDRIHNGLGPACAKACPTESIRFGYRDELAALARKRGRAPQAGVQGRPALRRGPERPPGRPERLLPDHGEAGDLRAARESQAPQRNVFVDLPVHRLGDRRRDRGVVAFRSRGGRRRAEMEPGLLKSADWPLLIDVYFFLGGIAAAPS